ncbi:hypothetical protein EVAR_42956_1 [Eumeta japonica]|uniref:FLYWCH-type domain-containing protein n=1 Tax=Eumeta variegata TaxID=151549 RepID=A0A4C1YFM3_EUMVA|nr:hypothetical protein EVAR_42956_1 [Eumeta japonica]
MSFKFVTLSSGKATLLLYRDYTFSKYTKNYWKCSKKPAGCKCKVKFRGGRIHQYVHNHNHPPPNFHITKEGMAAAPPENYMFYNILRPVYTICPKENLTCESQKLVSTNSGDPLASPLSIRYPIYYQEAGNSLVTLLKLRVSMGGKAKILIIFWTAWVTKLNAQYWRPTSSLFIMNPIPIKKKS